jgi:hypothetical protein
MSARTILVGSAGSVASFSSIGVSTAGIEAWLRILALLAGTTSALVTAYWVQRVNRAKVQRERHRHASPFKGKDND